MQSSNLPLSVNGPRLLESLAVMARLGATPKGGVNRQTLTDLDRDSRDLFRSWCEEAGLSVRVDAMGNMFARREGRDPERAPVLTGSHLDTQPTGGRFDGALGVLAGLEVMRALNDADYETESPLELVMWSNEEGCRFAPAMMGSGVWAGIHDLDAMQSVEDPAGIRFGDELRRIGYAGAYPCTCQGSLPAALIEIHIEQGPLLEDEGMAIGVVTGARAQRWYEVVLTGTEAHAGPTPMSHRRDALVGGATIVTAVNGLGERFAPDASATCGVLEVYPGSRNVVPGRIFLTVDLRHPDGDRLAAMDGEFRSAVEEAARKSGLEHDVREILTVPPIAFDPGVIEAVRNAAAGLDLSHRDIVSGAGHDAMNVATVAPAGMVFIPCVGGISHNEAEDALPDDITRGADVLLRALVELADQTPQEAPSA